MGEKIKLGEVQLFVGNTPIPVNIDTTPLVDNFEPHNDFEDTDWLKRANQSISFEIPMTVEIEKLRNELLDDFSRRYEQFMVDVEEAVTKILTEYIDDPFTTNPKEASKEEFEKRHINALVYQDLKDGSKVFLGVQQGTTLVCVNGMKIEDFDCRR